jgi:hypothetical protein
MQMNNKDEEMKDETITKEEELKFNEFRNNHHQISNS